MDQSWLTAYLRNTIMKPQNDNNNWPMINDRHHQTRSQGIVGKYR